MKDLDELIEAWAAAYARQGKVKKANALRVLVADFKMPEAQAVIQHIEDSGLSDSEQIILSLAAVIAGLD